MKRHKWAFIILIFLCVLTAIRLSWMHFLTTINYEDTPIAKEGILDLRGIEFNDKKSLRLDGEWEFYPSEFFTTTEEFQSKSTGHITVPNSWNTEFQDEDSSSFYYGTYRLRILIDNNTKEIFGLRINQKYNNATATYVNGELVGESGQPATELESYIGSNVPYTVSFKPDSNEIELIIHATSYRSSGGILKPIYLGTLDSIQYRTNLSIGLQLLLCGVLLLQSIYAAIMYFMNFRPRQGLLYFSIMLICAIISVLTSDDKLLFRLISVEYDLVVRITFLSYVGVGLLIPLIINKLFPIKSNKLLLRYYTIFCILYALFISVASPRSILLSTKVLFYVIFICSIIVATSLLRKATIHKGESLFLLLGCLSIGVNIIWTLIHNYFSIETLHYPFDLIIALLCFAAFWFKRFSRFASDAQQLAKKLRLENKRKDEFLVNTSHELRNPLHAITNVIQTILEDKTKPVHDEHRKQLSVLNNVGKRMSFMLNDLLDVTRLKEKTIPLNIQKTSLPSVVSGVTDMAKFMIEGKPIQLHVKIPDGFPDVLADETRLIQIIFNLLHNAIKYTDEGDIMVRATTQRDKAYIHIEDTGVGIQKNDLIDIFNPYVQTSENHKRVSGGFGLGLSICKQLVELHKGEIWVESSPGKGSIFTFTLPISKDGDVSIEHNNHPSILMENEIATTITDLKHVDNEDIQGKLKILVVDDDPVNINILHSILGRDGKYAITGITNPHETLKKLEEDAYDLVITDVMMPHISGYELTQMIRERFSISELPVLLLTARARTEDILAGFQSGANDYVTKPVDSMELKARVQALTALKVTIEEHIRMEGAWLHSQIQPHFIFNTLNSIAALGEIDIAKMQKLLSEFSQYLRLSIDFHNTDPVIPLERELSLVRSYLYIEQTRFANRLNIEWKLDSNTDLFLPPLSIQPLVENAVKHGILKLPKGGTITIQLKEELTYIDISITDNGIGMTEERTNQLLSDVNKDGRTSVGLRNVDTRLKQLYGKGLIIQSEPNQGTKVSFHIPKKE